MQLNYQIHGEGTPLIIVHGLFGTLENWNSQIKQLAEQYQVIAVDLRNHGRSPHNDEMNYKVMAADLLELANTLNIDKALWLGHSMGGKAVMQLAMDHPERVSKLVVVDIAPVAYPVDSHNSVIEGLKSIELDGLKNRAQAEEQLALHLQEPGVRAFLLKNLYRDEAKKFAWRMNLAALEAEYPNIAAAPAGNSFTGEVSFIKGADSDYISPEHKDAILSAFPNAKYSIIPGAGHWPHAEKPDVFRRQLLKFLQA